MKKYFYILDKEIQKCEKHKKDFGLQNCYNVFNDAVLCTYQYIKQNHFDDKELLIFAKSCL